MKSESAIRSIGDAHGSSQGSVHLDALRGAAALLVFANHTRALYFTSLLSASDDRTTVATVGTSTPVRSTTEVDGELKVSTSAVVVFFVLSGYLVGGSVLRSLRKGRWIWGDYMTKRLVRLLTVLIPAIVIGATLDTIGLHLFGPGSVYTSPRGIDLGVSADLVARLKPLVLLGNVAFLQNVRGVPIEGTNVSLWSLANEFWYYLAFPLAAISFFPNFPKLLRVMSIIAAGLILWFVGHKIAILFPVWMMGAFVSGSPIHLSKSQARFISVAATGTLVVGVLLMRKLHMASVPAEYIIGILTAVLLYGLVAQDWPSKPGLYRSVAAFFSKISYTLYLFHLPLAVFLCGLTNSPWRPRAKTLANLSLFALTDLVVLAIVVLMWFCFESRTNLIRDRLTAV